MSQAQLILSVIVVALDEASRLPRLAFSLHRARRPDGLRVELILVDGGSRDGTPEVAEAQEFDRVLRRPGASIPRCRNEGVLAAAGTWLAFVDADCEIGEDWFQRAAGYVFGTEATVIGWPTFPPPNGTWVQRAWAVHWRHKHRDLGVDGPAIRREVFRLITTRNMLTTKTAWQALDGFDESLLTGEDTDFVYRAEKAGLAVRADSALQVIHHGEPTDLPAFFRQQCWHANRRAYPALFRGSLGTGGRNAPLFTWGFLVGAVAFSGGLVLAVRHGQPAWLWGGFPLGVLILGPAVVVAFRAGSVRWVPALALLYTTYGLARVLDLVGIGRAKPSWRRHPASRS